jgi:hypothetical protein
MVEILGTLSVYLIQLPVVLVWLVGVILSLFYWQRHPQVSLWTLIAIVVLFAESFVSTYLNIWLPIKLHSAGWTSSQLALIYPVMGGIESLIRAVAWGFLLAAIFRGRNKS